MTSRNEEKSQSSSKRLRRIYNYPDEHAFQSSEKKEYFVQLAMDNSLEEDIRALFSDVQVLKQHCIRRMEFINGLDPKEVESHIEKMSDIKPHINYIRETLNFHQEKIMDLKRICSEKRDFTKDLIKQINHWAEVFQNDGDLVSDQPTESKKNEKNEKQTQLAEGFDVICGKIALIEDEFNEMVGTLEKLEPKNAGLHLELLNRKAKRLVIIMECLNVKQEKWNELHEMCSIKIQMLDDLCLWCDEFEDWPKKLAENSVVHQQMNDSENRQQSKAADADVTEDAGNVHRVPVTTFQQIPFPYDIEKYFKEFSEILANFEKLANEEETMNVEDMSVAQEKLRDYAFRIKTIYREIDDKRLPELSSLVRRIGTPVNRLLNESTQCLEDIRVYCRQKEDEYKQEKEKNERLKAQAELEGVQTGVSDMQLAEKSEELGKPEDLTSVKTGKDFKSEEELKSQIDDEIEQLKDEMAKYHNLLERKKAEERENMEKPEDFSTVETGEILATADTGNSLATVVTDLSETDLDLKTVETGEILATADTGNSLATVVTDLSETDLDLKTADDGEHLATDDTENVEKYDGVEQLNTDENGEKTEFEGESDRYTEEEPSVIAEDIPDAIRFFQTPEDLLERNVRSLFREAQSITQYCVKNIELIQRLESKDAEDSMENLSNENMPHINNIMELVDLNIGKITDLSRRCSEKRNEIEDLIKDISDRTAFFKSFANTLDDSSKESKKHAEELQSGMGLDAISGKVALIKEQCEGTLQLITKLEPADAEYLIKHLNQNSKRLVVIQNYLIKKEKSLSDLNGVCNETNDLLKVLSNHIELVCFGYKTNDAAAVVTDLTDTDFELHTVKTDDDFSAVETDLDEQGLNATNVEALTGTQQEIDDCEKKVNEKDESDNTEVLAMVSNKEVSDIAETGNALANVVSDLTDDGDLAAAEAHMTFATVETGEVLVTDENGAGKLNTDEDEVKHDEQAALVSTRVGVEQAIDENKANDKEKSEKAEDLATNENADVSAISETGNALKAVASDLTDTDDDEDLAAAEAYWDSHIAETENTAAEAHNVLTTFENYSTTHDTGIVLEAEKTESEQEIDTSVKTGNVEKTNIGDEEKITLPVVQDLNIEKEESATDEELVGDDDAVASVRSRRRKTENKKARKQRRKNELNAQIDDEIEQLKNEIAKYNNYLKRKYDDFMKEKLQLKSGKCSYSGQQFIKDRSSQLLEKSASPVNVVLRKMYARLGNIFDFGDDENFAYEQISTHLSGHMGEDENDEMEMGFALSFNASVDAQTGVDDKFYDMKCFL